MRYAQVVLVFLFSLVFFTCTVHADDRYPEDIQQLLNRVDELEKQLKKMEEESKARKSLEVTAEEKAEQEKEVLEAVSRDYTLSPQKTLSIDYSLAYSYSPSEQLTYDTALRLNSVAQHTITHSITTTYSALDNLAVSMTFPIVYRYDKVGTDESMDQVDIGDISFGSSFQPFKSNAGDIRSTGSFGITLPTGRSPYKVNPEKELSTGSGYYSLSAGANFSKQVDPVVAFWSLGVSYPLDVTGINHVVNGYTLQEVEPGISFSFSGGIAYALSYATSLNMSFSYSYQKNTTLHYKGIDPVDTGDSASASFGLGMGWRVSQKTTVSYSLSYSLTSSSFSISFRVPFTFVL